LLARTDLGLLDRAAADDLTMFDVLLVLDTRFREAPFLKESRLLNLFAGDDLRLFGFPLAFGAVLSGIAGLLVAPIFLAEPTMGGSLGLKGFVVSVIGGFGNLPGAVIGGLLLGALSSLLAVYLPDGLVPFRDAIVFTFPVLILIFRPHGLLGGEIGKARV